MNKAARRLAVWMTAVMMVFLSCRFPAKAAETYTITLYGGPGGYCINDNGRKQDTLALDVSAGTVLYTTEYCGEVSWLNTDTLLTLAGWQDAEGTVYDTSSTYTVTQDAELYAVWESLIDESALQEAISEDSSADESRNDESGSDESGTEESTAEESAAEESSPEESTAEESVAEESSAEESGTENSVSEESVVEESSAEEFGTEESNTEESGTEESNTEESSTEESSTEESGTEESNTEESATEESNTEESAIEESNTEESNTEESGSEESNTEESGSEESNTEESDTEESNTEESGSEESAEPSFTITFEGDGGYYLDSDGTQQSAISRVYNEGDMVELSARAGGVEWLNPDPHKQLSGWTSSAGDFFSIYDYQTVDITKDETLTAVWEDCVLITFDSGSSDAYFEYGEETLPAVTVVYPAGETLGYNVGEPVNTDPGKVFYGWDWDGDGLRDTTDYYGFAPYGDTTISALWADIFTATYDPNGGYYEYGDGTRTSAPYEYEGVFDYLNVPAVQHPDTTLACIGWAYDPDGDSMIPEDPAYDDLNGKTLYAVWLDISAKIDSTGKWVYEKRSKTTAQIVGYKGSSADLVLPETVDGLDVIAFVLPVASATDSLSTDPVSLTLPDCIESINIALMSHRTSLQYADLGNGLTIIPMRTFQGCSSLTDVVLSPGVTFIGPYAFAETALSEISLPSSVTQIDYFAFNNTALTSVDIPASCYFLGYAAFGDCSRLEEVTIRGTLSDFGGSVFAGSPVKTIRFKGDPPVDNLDPEMQTAFQGIKATAYYPVTWTSVPSSTYQGASNITWIQEPTVPVLQIDHQTAAPDQVLVNGTALTSDQYIVNVAKDADGSDVVVIELTEEFKNTLGADAGIEAVFDSEIFEGTVYAENISYAALSVENGSQTVEGSAADGLKPVVITVSGQASAVESVAVDGTVLDPGAYTVSAGSTVITLLEDYLATLPADTREHEAVVSFKDGGIATASFRIVFTPQETQDDSGEAESEAGESMAEESDTGLSDEESKAEPSSAADPDPLPPDTPVTGDPGYLRWLIAIAASGAVLALLIVFFLKKRKDK